MAKIDTIRNDSITEMAQVKRFKDIVRDAKVKGFRYGRGRMRYMLGKG